MPIFKTQEILNWKSDDSFFKYINGHIDEIVILNECTLYSPHVLYNEDDKTEPEFYDFLFNADQSKARTHKNWIKY